MMKSLNCPTLRKKKKQLHLLRRAVHPRSKRQEGRRRTQVRIQTTKIGLVHLSRTNLQLHPTSTRTFQSTCRCNPTVRKNPSLTSQLHPALEVHRGYCTDQEEDESEDSQRTRQYDDQEADLVLDEAHWSLMTSDQKICANSCQQNPLRFRKHIEGNPFLLGQVKGTFKPSNRCGISHQKYIDKDHVDRLCKNMTDDDRALLVLYSSKQESLNASSTSALIGKRRKEATATETKAYQRQFLEAKHLECKSWLDNEVFDFVDARKIQVRNWVTGCWVLTLKRDKDGTRRPDGSSEVFKISRRTISRQTVLLRPAIQAAAKGWNDQNCDSICQIPPEMGYPPHIGVRMKKPAYGLNDAPRRWWNILDSALRSYGLVPTRADRCTCVYYGKQLPKSSPISEKESSTTFNLEGGADYLMDPVSSNTAKNRQVHGALLCFVKVFKSVQKTRMIAFSLDNESNGSMTTSTVGTTMSTRTWP